jgi:hypothetical protein
VRSCVVCHAWLPRGMAMPVPPDAREGLAEEWLCLDERACDLRWTAWERSRLPGIASPGREVLTMILDTQAPRRLELTR